MTGRNIALAIAGLIVGATLAFGLLPARGPDQTIEVQSAGKALVGGPFTLTDMTGRRVTDKDFLGRPILVFFGYTHCPDICPSGLQVMAAALDKLGPKGEKVTPVFITLDPERDTPQVLSEYVKSFHPRLVGLTGSADEIKAVAKSYRVFYQKVADDKAPADYTYDHSAIFYLMGADGNFVTHIPHTTNPDVLYKALEKALT